MQAIVFDLGGTLMEYAGMPLNWTQCYRPAFLALRDRKGLSISEGDIDRSCEILASWNPRISGREAEASPLHIFRQVVGHWDTVEDPYALLTGFFEGMNLRPRIYDDTLPCLRRLKQAGYRLAALTDLPTAMPDEVFRRDIPEILQALDLYVSSASCGYRKPNKRGLLHIGDYLGVGMADILLVGDEAKDIQTAKNAGRLSALVTREGRAPGSFGQDYDLESLDELDGILPEVSRGLKRMDTAE